MEDLKAVATLEALAKAVSGGDSNATSDIVKQGLDDGIEAEKLLNEGLVTGMDIVNNRFKKHIMYIPEVLIAGRAMNKGVEILAPELSHNNTKPAGKFLIGTVQGDLHDIGKNIVKIMLTGKGFDIIDLGVDVSPEMFVERARMEEEDLKWIGMSALLTTTMPVMEKTLKALKGGGIKVKVMVGGAPVTEDYANKIGVSYAPDASSAANIAVELLDGERST